MTHPAIRHGSGPARQRGAVLYVALMILVLLALLGIVGMQVASMQEKMSSNFRAVNVAFQASERELRAAEDSIEQLANRTGSDDAIDPNDIGQNCEDGYDPSRWVSEQAIADSPAVNVRQIETCIQGEASLDMGQPLDNATPVYQITAYGSDRDEDNNNDGTSSTAIDTVFKL